MAILRDAAHAARSAFRGLGADFAYTRDAERKLNGFVLRWGHAEPTATNGIVVDATYNDMPIRFFVADESEEIQGVHRTGRFYEREELKLISEHYSGGAFLDVGANVGNHTLFAGLVLKAPKVIAIEPNPAAYRVLELNVLLNGLSQAVEILKCGLSARSARASIGWTNDFNLGQTRLEEGDGDIRLEAGDDVVADHIGFVKIDTEGFELDVLKGLTRTIQRCRPKMFVEVEPSNDAAFQAYVREIGYRVTDTYQRYEDAVNYLLDPA